MICSFVHLLNLRKMNKCMIFRLLTIITVLWGLTSCAVGLWEGDELYYAGPSGSQSGSLGPGMSSEYSFMYFVRLEDGDGNNLLDTADALTKEPVSYECQIIRESDQALMTFEQRRVNDDHVCETFDPLLCLQWSDFDLLSDKDKPIVYEQAYTTHLQITHADVTEQHQIRWNLRVEGKMHCVTSCEVDGQEVEANVVVKVKWKM